MNIFHPTEACIICLQIPQLDLISINSYSSIEISNLLDNGNLKAELITDEAQIAFMLTDISGHNFDSTNVNASLGICEHCVKDLTTAYKFKKRCSAAFQQLTFVSSPKSNKDECFEQAMTDNSVDGFEDETNNISIEMVEIEDIDMDNNTNTNQFECSVCNQKFVGKTHLQRHMKIHTDDKAFECTILGCDSRFRRSDFLRKHIRTRHTENELQNEESAVNCPEKQIVNISLDEFKDDLDNTHIEVLEIQRIDEDKNTIRKFECEVCNKVFVRKMHLIRHMTIHTDERAFECIHCNQKFRRRDHLQNHLNTHSQIKHECSYCQQTYSKANQLRKHIKAQHTENEVQNEESAIIFPKKEIVNNLPVEFKDESPNTYTEVLEIQEMVQENNTTRKFECELCNKVFSRKTHLIRHMTIHTNERAFECTITGCGSKFRRRDHLQNHLNTHSQLKTHKCEFCENSFGRADHLLNHIRARHTEKEPKNNTDVFNCAECNRSFSSQKNLQAHERSHSKIVNCKRCDAQFSSTIEMKKHVSELHPNELKNHLCSECGIAFSRHDYLLIHMRRHRGEMRYHCSYCQKGFFRSTDVRIHEKYHTNEKTHVCSICQKKFSRSYNLTIHMRVHTGEKPFVCTHTNCSQAFAQSNDLKVHLRRHTGERFKCDVDNCNDSFIQMYLLTRHKRDVHGIDIQSHIKRLTKFIPLELPEESTRSVNRLLEMTSSSNCTAPSTFDE